jgi:hypothetical protein
MSVNYRCKICGREHLAPMKIGGKESFESGSMKSIILQCQVTGRSASYVKNNMRWKD